MSDRRDLPAGLRQCFGKAKYSSQAFALKIATRCEAARGTKLRAYWCGMCSRWHLTKAPSAAERNAG